RRLPIKKIVLRFGVTEKVVKRSKKFIIAVVIIINKNLSALKNWIRK
ncbi:RNA polymerase subunit sigma, partial [Clostridium butyricum]